MAGEAPPALPLWAQPRPYPVAQGYVCGAAWGGPGVALSPGVFPGAGTPHQQGQDQDRTATFFCPPLAPGSVWPDGDPGATPTVVRPPVSI